MFRSLALSLVVVSAYAANARADFFDTSATIASNPTVANVNQIIGTSSGGFVFNNAVSTPAISPGSAINFTGVGSDLITNYGLAGGGNAPGGAHFGAGFDIVKVFAVSGSSAIGAGGATVNTITTGGMLLRHSDRDLQPVQPPDVGHCRQPDRPVLTYRSAEHRAD